jgi:hypothetical protein
MSDKYYKKYTGNVESSDIIDDGIRGDTSLKNPPRKRKAVVRNGYIGDNITFDERVSITKKYEFAKQFMEKEILNMLFSSSEFQESIKKEIANQQSLLIKNIAVDITSIKNIQNADRLNNKKSIADILTRLTKIEDLLIQADN